MQSYDGRVFANALPLPQLYTVSSIWLVLQFTAETFNPKGKLEKEKAPKPRPCQVIAVVKNTFRLAEGRQGEDLFGTGQIHPAGRRQLDSILASQADAHVAYAQPSGL